MVRGRQGFTLIELLVVISIVGILAAVAIPGYNRYLARAVVAEGLAAADPIRARIEEYYAWRGQFPADNHALHLNPPPALFSRATSAIRVDNGAIQIRYRRGWQGMEAGGTLSLRPLVNRRLPDAPLIWSCDSVGREGFLAVGEWLTDLDDSLIPAGCKE